MLYAENIGLRDCSGFLQIGSHLFTAQTSSFFKWLDMCTSTSTTPTFVTEALRLVT